MATFGAQDLQATAEAEIKAKKEFLSMLAHELRNPLAPIMTANGLLEKLAIAHPMLPKLHDVIDRQTRHLKRLVEDLLDASRISSGKITLRRNQFLLSDIIESAIETSQPLLTQRKQKLVLTIPTEPIVIDGDSVRLAQVFSNLLINAAKFSDEGKDIRLDVDRQSDQIEICVADNGVGIALEFQPYVFDLFTQGKNTLDRTQGGLGIGLSLVRSLVEMHGGSTKVRSDGLGKGSKFFVTLPISAPRLALANVPSLPTLPKPPLRLLIIEDNIDANDTLSTLLRLEGNTVDSALDGKTGIEMAQRQAYDVVLCDIGLPVTNGFEVVQQLKRLLNPPPRFIAVTGYNQPKDRLRASRAGFDHFLVKPIAIDALLKVMSSSALN
ncbi:hybrid sensor histidine kinase/response regulator [Actimicrobium antarcticum]|uniref:hybrid sensor histidine kinase/response regulator n=1 Tax=Actimicrobium antarcticum TaxID=1051899 RepID=UPI0031D67ADF